VIDGVHHCPNAVTGLEGHDAVLWHSSDAIRRLNAMGELVGNEILHDVVRHRINML
jgi:hypothetical protein